MPGTANALTSLRNSGAASSVVVASKAAHRDVTLGAVSTQTSKSTGESYKGWALTVPDNYPVPSSALAREQLIKGGYHLAALLKAIWPEA